MNKKLISGDFLMLIGLVGVIEVVKIWATAPWWIVIIFAVSFAIFSAGLGWYIDDAVGKRINELEKEIKNLER